MKYNEYEPTPLPILGCLHANKDEIDGLNEGSKVLEKKQKVWVPLVIDINNITFYWYFQTIVTTLSSFLSLKNDHFSPFFI